MAKLPSDVAIRVRDIHKDFLLPHTNDRSIKHRVITAFRKKDKKVDVNRALRGVSFDIKKGEFFGIVGRNGSGKSTLLKIISKIYQPTSGTAEFQGKLVAFIELGVGFNPQLTGRDNVYLNAAMLGFSRKETDAMYDEIVAFAELEKFMDLDLKNYSSGMKVRLAFSVAIRAQADILVLDEVLAVGDAAFKRKCYHYFTNLKEAHKTIILVSHSMGLIKQYCDRAILIEDGKVAYDGPAEETADEYTELFVELRNQNNDPDQRLGSGEVRFDKIDVRVNRDRVLVDAYIQANADVKDVLIGVNISDRGRVLTGTSQLSKDEHKQDLQKGDKKHLRFEFENKFGGNQYFVNASIHAPEGVFYDRWKKAAEFTNKDAPQVPTDLLLDIIED